MRAGKSSVDQLTRIGMARRQLHFGTAFVDVYHPVDIGKIEARFHSLGEQIKGQSDNIHIAGTLAITEKCALHPVSSGH